MTTILLGPATVPDHGGAAIRSSGSRARRHRHRGLAGPRGRRRRARRGAGGSRPATSSLYRRLTDVLDSDPQFAEAALAHRDAVDELAGIYSLRLQRALDSVYTVQRRRVRDRHRRAALGDGIAEVGDRLVVPRTPSTSSTASSGPPRRSARASRSRGTVARSPGSSAQAGALVIAGGHVGLLLRCLKLFDVTLRRRAAGRGLVGRGDGADRAGRALRRPRPAAAGRLGGLGPRARTSTADRGDAARPPPAADRQPAGAAGPRPPVRARPLPAARPRRPRQPGSER